MKQEELQEILRKHKLWLNGEEGGERANLTLANLPDADLIGAYLRNANLNEVDLNEANIKF